jgi:hypothetical protein
MIILEMPASGAAMQEFEPQRVDYAAPESGGRLGGVQAGFPLWLAVWTWGTIGARRSDLLPAGLILSVGDYCDFRWTATSDDVAGMTWRDLVRVTADPDGISGDNGFVAMADADGTVTVMVDPPVSGVTPDEAVAHLDRPACIMAIVTDKTKLSGIDRRLALKSGSTIVGLQDLRP